MFLLIFFFPKPSLEYAEVKIVGFTCHKPQLIVFFVTDSPNFLLLFSTCALNNISLYPVAGFLFFTIFSPGSS